jgi:hypothetical protein
MKSILFLLFIYNFKYNLRKYYLRGYGTFKCLLIKSYKISEWFPLKLLWFSLKSVKVVPYLTFDLMFSLV